MLIGAGGTHLIIMVFSLIRLEHRKVRLLMNPFALHIVYVLIYMMAIMIGDAPNIK